ncbi:HTH-type transcriptional dual regulator CecR [anaerobic digester metagenome]
MTQQDDTLPDAGQDAGPHQTRGRRTRERLLEEGLRLFAERGFEGVGIREVAAAAKTNIASIAFHFAGKEGLYAAVIARVAGELAALHRAALDAAAARTDADASPAARAGVMVAQLTEALLASNRSQSMSLLLQREFITPTASFDTIYDVALRPTLEAFSALVAAACGTAPATIDCKALAFSLFIVASAFARNKNTFLHFSEATAYTAQDAAAIGRALAAFVTAGLTRHP